MVGIYFSGTGSTKFCIKKFLNFYENGAMAFSIEDGQAITALKQNEEIVFAYPVYFSNMPKIVRDFINNNRTLFSGKKIFVIAAMGLFSGDGAGLFGQRLWFYNKTKKYSDKLHIESEKYSGLLVCHRISGAG